MVKIIQDQSDGVQQVALRNLKFNSFGILPENMLYFMMKAE